MPYVDMDVRMQPGLGETLRAGLHVISLNVDLNYRQDIGCQRA